jgi:hypothetical protein
MGEASPKALGDLLLTTFSGAWGEDPRPGLPTATVLRSTDLDSQGHVDTSKGALRSIPRSTLSSKRLEPEDLLLETSGGSPTQPVGRVAYFPGDCAGDYLTSNFFRVLRVCPEVDAKYLLHLLVHRYHQAQIWRFQQQTTGLINLNFEDYLNQTVDLPAPIEQGRVAEILDTIDERIRISEAFLDKLYAIGEGLLLRLLRGADGRSSSLASAFEVPPADRLPRGWRLMTIGELAAHVGSGLTPRGGSRVYRRSGVTFLRSQNVHFAGLRLDDVAYIDERTHRRMRRSEVFPHDVLLNITGASIGRCCPVPEGLGSANVNQHVCAIRLEEASWRDALVLSAFIGSRMGQHQIDVVNAGGSREGLNYEQVQGLRVVWPSTEERERIARIVSSHQRLIEAERRSLQKTRALKWGVAAALFSSRLRAPVGAAV